MDESRIIERISKELTGASLASAISEAKKSIVLVQKLVDGLKDISKRGDAALKKSYALTDRLRKEHGVERFDELPQDIQDERNKYNIELFGEFEKERDVIFDKLHKIDAKLIALLKPFPELKVTNMFRDGFLMRFISGSGWDAFDVDEFKRWLEMAYLQKDITEIRDRINKAKKVAVPDIQVGDFVIVDNRNDKRIYKVLKKTKTRQDMDAQNVIQDERVTLRGQVRRGEFAEYQVADDAMVKKFIHIVKEHQKVLDALRRS